MGYWPGAQKQDQKTVNAVVKGEMDTTTRCSPGPRVRHRSIPTAIDSVGTQNGENQTPSRLGQEGNNALARACQSSREGLDLPD